MINLRLRLLYDACRQTNGPDRLVQPSSGLRPCGNDAQRRRRVKVNRHVQRCDGGRLDWGGWREIVRPSQSGNGGRFQGRFALRAGGDGREWVASATNTLSNKASALIVKPLI